jgi:hypothetical protein
MELESKSESKSKSKDVTHERSRHLDHESKSKSKDVTHERPKTPSADQRRNIPSSPAWLRSSS